MTNLLSFEKGADGVFSKGKTLNAAAHMCKTRRKEKGSDMAHPQPQNPEKGK